MNAEDRRERVRRRAIRMQIGGFRPPEAPGASWFGRVDLALPGEAWPTTGGAPMNALCQINLTELPFRPRGLEDVELVAVFIGPHELPAGTPNGVGWCLRAYPRVDALVPLAPAASGIRAFPMRPEVIEADYPCREDLPEDLDDEDDDRLPNAGGFKLGGWPTLIQGEISWESPSTEYVFQIDSNDKAHWSWGDAGVGYFGRDSAGEWALDWQCY